jgi:hypothetical protein
VFRHRGIKDSTRVLLLWLADRMDANRKVRVPREEVAEALGLSSRRVAERVRDAREAGLLTVVTRGQKGRTAVYQGTYSMTPVGHPDEAFSMSPTSTLMHDPRGSRCNPVQHDPRGSHPYNGTAVDQDLRDVGNDEGAVR